MSMLNVSFLKYLFVEIIKSSLKVRYNICDKIVLRCIQYHDMDVMCVITAINIYEGYSESNLQ
jgi:hypothetical protein